MMVKSIFKTLVFISGAMVVLASCERMPVPGSVGKRILVNVNTHESIGTKAGLDQQYLGLLKSESGDMVLEGFVSDLGSQFSPRTKGTTITNGTITSKEIKIEGWLGSDIDSADAASEADKADHHFIKDASLTYGSSEWNLSVVDYWRNAIPTTFWSYVAPSAGNLNISWPDDAADQLSFSYTLPASNDSGDALLLQDFLLAYNEETRNVNEGTGSLADGQSEYFDILLHHPLAAVKFDVASLNGSTDPSSADYVDITKIELVNVATGGDFTATGSGSDVTFTCTPSSEKDSYAQTAGVSRANIEGGMFTGEASEYVFFMIPQDLSDVKVNVTFTKRAKAGDPLQSVTKTVSLAGSWESEKYYIYRISATVNVLGEDVHFTDPTDPEGNKILGDIIFTSNENVEQYKYVSYVDLTGAKYVRFTWQQELRDNSKKTEVAQLFLIDLSNPEIDTRKMGEYDYTYNGVAQHYVGFYDLLAHNETNGEYIFKLDGKFGKVSLGVLFYNPHTGGKSCTWTLKNVPGISFEVLELM